MSAARLREAAALMRERADAATPGPWKSHARAAGIQCSECITTTERHYIAQVAPVGHYSPDTWLSGTRGHDEAAARGDSEHIASWPPEVALTVATWLEDEALGETNPDTDGWLNPLAVALADAYLGAPQ